MKRILLAIVLGTSTAAGAVDLLTFAEAKSSGARKLSRQELVALLAGATAVNETAFFARTFQHRPDGSLVAGTVAPDPELRDLRGAWRIADDGRYCITVDWRFVKENWCRWVYRVGDAYYVFEDERDETVSRSRFTVQ